MDGIETSLQLSKVKGENTENENITYLTPNELEIIKNADLQSESLINARNLLLFDCCIGQRGGDLLKITESNFVTRNGLELIELKQQKTGKNMAIPILQETKDILKGGLPKKVCELSSIDEKIKGSKIMMLDK
jgi:integrase